ncbi:T-cell activation Rho GTPase-activating protein-like isoform X2 [Corvus moneduloides]|uniref:T-cell activation Rho GTPase-activating protein-like isoform X2 n=1 Tax=Corvus moneduloides TaxID=1196302 RepID=UPI001362BAC4|nr:T-cell activation Rho GTPase-activating protein-like isoform X2 [Corvus moneduloides]
MRCHVWLPGTEGAVGGHAAGDPGSPSEPCAIHQTPGEGVELLPCRQDSERQRLERLIADLEKVRRAAFNPSPSGCAGLPGQWGQWRELVREESRLPGAMGQAEALGSRRQHWHIPGGGTGSRMLGRAERPAGQRLPAQPRSGCWGWAAAGQWPFVQRGCSASAPRFLQAGPQQGLEVAPSGDGQGLDLSPAAGTGSSGRRRRRRWLPWPFALRRGPAGAARAPGQEGSGCSRALFGQPLAAVCAEDGTLPRPIQELLAVLHQEGPTTEGIFRKAESAKARQELRQALDHGLHVDMASQPVLLLAMVLKDFLQSIPGKLLVTDLYEDWTAAMQMASREDKICQLKEVAKKLPAANLLLLRQLLALLRLIGQHVSSSRMTCSSLAVCLGPKLLSPLQEEQLELEAMLAEKKQVNALVDFTLEDSGDIFGEQVAGPNESPAPTELCTEMHREEQSGSAGREDDKPQAESNPDASPSLPETRQGDGEETMVLEVQRAENFCFRHLQLCLQTPTRAPQSRWPRPKP